MTTKKEVLRKHLPKYLKASKEEKSKIIDGLELSLGLHRKSVIRGFKREQMRISSGDKSNKPGRKLFYTPDVAYALKEIWEASSKLCAERLHPILSEYIDILIRDKMWKHDNEATDKLKFMSLGTMKNRIKEFKRIKAGGRRSTTKPSNLKELIPIRRGAWNNPEPGFGEIDTIVHCGFTLLGIMAYTVNFTDIATTWTESAAQMNKGRKETLKNIKNIKKRLPFPLLGLDPDTGSEFINWHLYGWCIKNDIELSRSRPNHKNDNAHIEQKNYSAVRKFMGYDRIDSYEAVELMNELYSGPLRLYINFFQPSMKCIRKERIGSRYVRKYDEAKTPYQRVMEHPGIDKSVKNKLAKQKAALNPLLLKREIDKMIDKIFKVQKAANNA